MIVDQRIQWVALPAGGDADGTLHLSVFVAPRLRTDGPPRLSVFPDMLDWPALIRDTSFAVKIGAETIPAVVASDPPDSALWSALFPPQTPLLPFVFDDYADRPFVTYSVTEVLSALRTLYASIAASSPDDLPQIQSRRHAEPPAPGLIELFGGLRAVTHGPLYRGVAGADDRVGRVGALLNQARTEAATRRSTIATRGGPMLEPLPANGTLSRHFERALLFHSRAAREPVEMPDGGEHYAKTIDFHQMLAALGDHPWLMRRLGLIIDLDLSAAKVPEATVAAHGELALQPNWVAARAVGSVDVLPSTAYVHQIVNEKTYFVAAPHQPDPTAPPNAPPTGLLPMTAGTFSLEQVDVDGAVLKTLNLAVTLDAISNRPDPTVKPLHEPDQIGVPALRTSGLVLLETGRAASLQAMFSGNIDVNAAIEGSAPVTFFAEDLVRGYRMDVLDTRYGTWRSLHRRVVTAEADRFAGSIQPIEEEGFFQLSLAGAPAAHGGTPDPNGELYVHESLITWDGWSLSAPRPGKALSRERSASTGADGEDQPARITNTPFTAMGLRIESSAKAGTLPRLRFDHSYRVRLRNVNLAGGGPTIEEADQDLASAATATPVLPAVGATSYLRFEPVSGPALVPAQRFGEGASLGRLVIRSNAGMSAHEYAAAFNSSDFVVGGDHQGYSDQDVRHVAPPKVAFEMIERHGLLDSVLGSDGSAPGHSRQAAIAAAYEIARREKGTFDDPSLPTSEVVELSTPSAGAQRYIIHHEEQLEVPYLPDPFATGAVFFGLPGRPTDQPLKVTFDGILWYKVRPLRLRLVDGTGAPEWDPGTRVLTAHLPQASSAKIRICSLFGGNLAAMGILQWCKQVLSKMEFERVYRAAKENRAWLITPWHNVELVHAVQQPLAAPEWVRFEVGRSLGQSSADLFGEVTLHIASTEKIDLEAIWSETVDDLARPGPELRKTSTIVFELRMQDAGQGRTDVDPHEIPYSLRDRKLLTFFTARRGQVEPHQPTPHTFADTHYRRITYRIVATTSFRENFPPDWVQSPELLTRTSVPQEVDVLSSAPPAPPKVLYAMPTQGWESHAAGGTTIRERRGGGLRVYLDRPWFSSGDGELLGVVVGGSVTSPKADDYPYITLFGQDPIRGGAPLEFPTPASFRNAVLITTPIEILELRDRFTVVAYTPVYDYNTQRWFCDLNLDTGEAYLPFVRLALVRYQPHALSGCEVSHVVVADIVQTLPDRILTVTRTGLELRITVAGVSYTAIQGAGAIRSDDNALATVIARLYQRDSSIPDNLLGWKAIKGAEVVLTRALNGVMATWTGKLVMPPADGIARRLVVTEEEHFAVDEQTPGQDGLGSRIIYADSLEV